MILVGISDPGLLVLPTHRIVSGFPALDADRLASILGKHFEVEKVGIGEKGRSRLPGSESRWTAGKTCSASAPPTASGSRRGSGRRRRWPVSLRITARPGAAWRWRCCTSSCWIGCCPTRSAARRRAGTSICCTRRRTRRATAGSWRCSAGHDAPRRADRRQSGENAAEINVFLLRTAQRAGVRPLKGS